jgi:hypothetical protein
MFIFGGARCTAREMADLQLLNRWPSDFRSLDDSSPNIVNVRDLHRRIDPNTNERRRTHMDETKDETTIRPRFANVTLGLDKGRRRSLLFRSRRQHPATTCNLSRVGSYPRIQVRGRSWSSVAVYVDTDVGALRSGTLLGYIFARRAPDSLSGASRSDSSRGQRDRPISCTLEPVWHPVDLAQPDHTTAQGQPSTESVRALCGSAPGLSCGSPWRGRRDATHCPPGPAAADSCARPSRRPACPARAGCGRAVLRCAMRGRVELLRGGNTCPEPDDYFCNVVGRGRLS